MALVRIDSFAGLNLRKDPKKPPLAALVAKDCDIETGSLNASYGLDTANAVDLVGRLNKRAVYTGAAADVISTPDAAANSITGDIDIRVRVKLTDWTPAAAQIFAEKWAGGGMGLSYRFYNSLGIFTFDYSSTFAGGSVSYGAGAAHGIADGTVAYARVTRSASTGEITFYKSTDYDPDTNAGTWTQVGATGAGIAEALLDTAGDLRWGSTRGGGSALDGSLYRGLIYTTIGGDSPVVDLDPNDWSSGSTFSSSGSGEIYTIGGDVTISDTDLGEASEAGKTLYNLHASTWLEWVADVDIAPNPLADNSAKRVYFTGDDVPKLTDFATATAGPTPYPARSYVLGIPVYPAIRAATASGGSGSDQDRAYVYTFTSPWGEEGPPSTPVEVTAKETGASVLLESIGVATRRYTGAPITPTGIPCTVTFVAAPTPGYLEVAFSVAGYNTDFRVGDRCYLSDTTPTEGNQSYLISYVDTAGNGKLRLAASCWPATAAPNVYRVLPANTYNVVNAVKDTPRAGLTRVYVDTTEGLRKGERVTITEATGMTALNATWTVGDVNLETADKPCFDIELSTTQAYTSGGVAKRTAPHNTGEVRITNMTIAAGIVTATLESTAEIEVNDEVLIFGAQGAYQANGLRTVLSVTQPTTSASGTITFALAAMGAYTSGGMLIRPIPYAFTKFTVTNVTSAGGPLPAPFTVTLTIPEPHDMEVGELVLGYDIGGSVEANTVMVVSAVASGSVTCKAAQGVTAYTAGGKIVRLEMQMKKRIYRTATGSSGAEYQLVAEVPGETAVVTDQLDDEDLAEELTTDGWIQPPTDMHSVIAHPHQFLAGLSGNVLCLSVPGAPHAFPIALQKTLPTDGIALGIDGTTIYAFTSDIPYRFTGVDPETMLREGIPSGEPCTAKRSVRSTKEGVAYRGKTGMFLLGFEGGLNSTRDFLPSSLFSTADVDVIGGFWGNKYVWVDNATQQGYIFDPLAGERALTQFTIPYQVFDLHVSPVDGQMWAAYLDGSTAKRAPIFNVAAAHVKYDYQTQYIRLEKPASFGWLQVDFDWDGLSATMKDREAAIVRNLRRRMSRHAALNAYALNGQAVNGSDLETIYSPDTTLTTPAEQYLKLTIIAEPDTDHAETVFDDFVVNEEPVRIANGIRASLWQVKLVGNVRVTAVTLASSVAELKAA